MIMNSSGAEEMNANDERAQRVVGDDAPALRMMWASLP